MTDWIAWIGGKCPVEPETVVEVRLRGPYEVPPAPAGRFRWDCVTGNLSAEIVGYRVVNDNPPEKPFSTRITEAEEKALEAVKALRGEIHKAGISQAVRKAYDETADAIVIIQTAAALARDYARKEG